MVISKAAASANAGAAGTGADVAGYLRPKLYFISGSPPSWRVMLALTAKRIDFEAVRLTTDNQGNRTPEYLQINPRGQVPTLMIENQAIRESIAILAMLERLWPETPLFGRRHDEAAVIWTTLLDFENNLMKAAGEIARTLFREQLDEKRSAIERAVDTLIAELHTVDELLSKRAYVCGDGLSAADIHLYPTLAWLERALTKAPTAAATLPELPLHTSALERWSENIRSLPGFDNTVPPHWKS